ncbi:MAG: hypothetical protein JWQ43_776, partial [Glaciihabitans sp.]|nr:hypothetical protein [Glaciihabitans sp.]
MPETASDFAGVLPAVDALRTAICADDTTTASAEFAELTAGLELGELTRVLLAVEEAARERHLRAGIPLDITAATLADVGRKLDAYGATVDRPWLVSLLRGDVLAFGRLQFEATMPDDGRALHIPEGGSLTATEVDDALARADAFIGGRTVVCTSWLFDPALAALPETSNISAFVRRFDV